MMHGQAVTARNPGAGQRDPGPPGRRMTAEEIIAEYPTVTVASVREAAATAAGQARSRAFSTASCYCSGKVPRSSSGNAQGSLPFLQIGASARWWDTYLADLPVTVQRALFAALGPIARPRGYRTICQRFSAS
jgi:hypothetical protein